MAPVLIQLALKASLVLAVTWLIAGSMRRGSAAARHLVWTLGIVATFALPLMRAVGPTWAVTVPESAWFAAASPAATHALTESPALDEALFPAQAARSPEPAAPDSSNRMATRSSSPAPDVSATPARMWRRLVPTFGPIGWAVAAWLMGVVLLLTRLISGLVRARRMARRAEPVTDEGWIAAFDQAAAAMAIDRPVALRHTADTTVPVACGLWRSTVLLPRNAEQWDEERRMVVLLHELAHVRRHDCLVQCLAQATRAIHWVNPLAHLALHRVRAEQERACDDLVLAAGTDAPAYADHLFEIARSFRAPAPPAWATLAMARPSQLEGRLMAILDEQCNRAPLARRARFAATVSAVLAIVALGALHLTAATPAAALNAGGRVQHPDALADRNADALRHAVVTPESETPTAIAFRVFEHVTGRVADHIASHVVAHLGDGSARAADPSPRPEPGADPDPDPEDVTRHNPLPGIVAASFALAGFQQPPVPPASPAPAQPPVTDETRRRVADALATALNDENEDVRSQALNSLAAMRDPRAVPALLKALSDPSVRLRTRAVDGLGQFDTPEALDGLMSALKDANPDVREQAARMVGGRMGSSQLQDPKYTEAFLALLKDQVPDVREQAILMLGRMRNRQAVPALVLLLKDPTVDVRERTAQALGQIADPAAIDALTAALKDADAGVREQAAVALGRIARGQRRDGPRGVPVPPIPPGRPLVQLDIDHQRIAETARKAMEQGTADLERSLDDIDKTISKSLDKAFEKSDKR